MFSLYAQRSLAATPHQRSLSLQLMETITENPSQKSTAPEEPNPNRYSHITAPVSTAQGTAQKREQKDFKTQNTRKSVAKEFLLQVAS